ncbi:MAG: glycoside hydrolase family 31 protein [Phycisphaerales bacterium]|nr:glycoside hydrolase family 31 protein [Phycisphaerales bacterium]
MRTSVPRPAPPALASPALLATLTLALLASVAAAQPRAGSGELIGESAWNIARFTPTGLDAAKLPPSYAFERSFPRAADLPAAFAVTPMFDAVPSGDGHPVATFSAHINVPAGTSLYGTGEIGGPLLRNGRTSTLWNTDAYGYKPDAESLYQSHPWVLAVRPDGSAFGVLADTTWRTNIDLTSGITFTGEGAAFPVYVVDGASPQEVMQGLGRLIGPMPLPPKWAIGYHQCRYSYYPEKRVREIADGFRSKQMPCDVIWFDIDYMDGYRVFTFDKNYFPDVKKLNSDLNAQGFHTIYMIDPGVKAEPGYSIYDQVMSSNFGVQNAAGETYKGAVWPGQCVFPDYTRPEVRTWWAGLFKDFMANGIDGVWNDMNEPAIFSVASKTMPEDNKHLGGKEPFGTVAPGPHAQFHNVYGMLMAKGTFDGIKAAKPDKRPFVLTRAGYIGSQRYAATWTGDNSADWNDLEQSVPMALNLGLSGQPFSGPDIGGFNGNGPQEPKERAEHFSRWFGIGTLLPFCRSHTGKGNIDKEPWAFGGDAEVACRLALERRYRLLPYYYTLFHEASRTNMPVVRPVFFADPTDPILRGEDDCFLVGSDLLVVPSMQPDHSRIPVEPIAKNGTWLPVELVGENGNKSLPVLKVRPGAIVPIGPVMQWSGEKPLDPLTLLINLDDTGHATGTLYEDAGEGYGYRDGAYLLTTFTAERKGDSVTVTIKGAEGRMAAPARGMTVRVLTANGEATATGSYGKSLTVPIK